MSHLAKHICLAALMAMPMLLLGPVRVEAQKPAAPTKQVRSPDQIAELVRQLEADEFLARETAMLDLVAAGPSAVPALKQAALEGSLESASRALFVLQRLGLSSNQDVQELARLVLLEIAQAKEHPAAARRAEAALTWLTEQRSVQALADLERLGAKINRNEIFNGFAAEEMIESIELGPDFKGEEDDLRRLRWLDDVPILTLAGEKVTDSWIARVASLRSLTQLHLYQTKVTDSGLSELENHPSIQQLGVYYVPVTDGILKHLQKMPALHTVKLYGTRVTRETVEELKLERGPTVDHRRGAFMGVGCTDMGDGACMISTVHPDSPAHKAGLLPEDVLIRFADVEVTDFKKLTAEISNLDVSDEVEVEVERRVEDDRGDIKIKRVMLKVKLGPWDLTSAVRNGFRP